MLPPQAAPAPGRPAPQAPLFPGHMPDPPPARDDILAPLRLHQGALREGRPRAPGPSQLRAPPSARGPRPARSPGPWPEEKRPAQCPAFWVISGASLALPWTQLTHLCIGATTPSFFSPNSISWAHSKTVSPRCDWAGPGGTLDLACTKNTNVQSLIKRVSCFSLCLSVPISASPSEPSL